MAQRTTEDGDTPWDGYCQRCAKKVYAHIMSMFCRQEICLKCSGLERVHPEYRAALDANDEAYRRGETQFPGIGLPEDLQ